MLGILLMTQESSSDGSDDSDDSDEKQIKHMKVMFLQETFFENFFFETAILKMCSRRLSSQ